MKYLILILALVAGTALADFTPIKPSDDSRLIYVSSSQGDDSNDCLSEVNPCKSIAAAIDKTRDGHPDHVYLKRGDTWRDETLNGAKGGRSDSEPAVIAFYGDAGDRPKLEADVSLFNISKARHLVTHLHIIGLHFSAYKLDPAHPEFNGGDGSGKANLVLLGANTNVLFEDNVFDHVETVIQAWELGDPKDITFRRNIWTGAYVNTSSHSQDSKPSNAYISGVDGFTMEQNVMDHGGWHPTVPGAAANMYNHNLYMQTNNVGNKVLLRENIFTRAAAEGAKMRSGGRLENNFFARNAIASSFGYFRTPITSGAIAHAVNNVVTEGHSMVKGDKPCSGPNLCTPALWGIVMDEREIGNAKTHLSGNLVHSHSPDDNQWKGQYSNLVNKSLGEKVIGWEEGVHNAGRTLADYNQALGGERDFDAFMDKALSRGLQQWPVELSAAAINDYIREGTIQQTTPAPVKVVAPVVKPAPVQQLPPMTYQCELVCTSN